MYLSLENLSFSQLDPQSYALADRFYLANKYKVHCGKRDCVYVFWQDQKIVACVRLTPSALQVNTPVEEWLLRNLCVAKTFRGQGIARAFMQALIPALTKNVFLFALPNLVEFYRSLGFFTLDVTDNLPHEIIQRAQTYQSRGRDWVLMGWFHSHANGN